LKNDRRIQQETGTFR